MLRGMKPFPILNWLSLCLRRARTRRQLGDLPPHLLRDIGIDEAAQARECARWLWQGVAANDARDAANKNARELPARVARLQMKSDQALRRSRTTTSTRAIS
ncbi:MAG: DUF1127 domain-containing protein [Pseudolabrys sp.]|nr:DUF1127 domain-containing protein [Pseudolabrys sp.]